MRRPSEIDIRLSGMGLFIQRAHPLNEPVFYYFDRREGSKLGKRILEWWTSKGGENTFTGRGAAGVARKVAKQMLDSWTDHIKEIR